MFTFWLLLLVLAYLAIGIFLVGVLINHKMNDVTSYAEFHKYRLNLWDHKPLHDLLNEYIKHYGNPTIRFVFIILFWPIGIGFIVAKWIVISILLLGIALLG